MNDFMRVDSDWSVVPSPGELLRRMEVPGSGGTASQGVESPPAPTGVSDAKGRLEQATALLKRLAETDGEVDEADVDRMIHDAEEALRKLDSEGQGAALTSAEAFATEAVIEADGSRPVLFVQDGTIDLSSPDLTSERGAHWREPAARLISGINQVALSVGAVQLPAFLGEDGSPRRVGTGFVIGEGLVLTNRHVLEAIATASPGGWAWKFDVEIDFVGEYQRDGKRIHKPARVLKTGSAAINRMINFNNPDYAILELEAAPDLPKPLAIAPDPAASLVGAGQPQIYVMGFPAQPFTDAGAPDAEPPRPGHEYAEILEKLFRNRFGSKRWAPGMIEAGPGQLAGDPRKWVMSHDASTLGGNSGSCVVEFQNSGATVLGLHFGGMARKENWAHVLAALREDFADVPGITWQA
ncbi:trypsin-like serine peptidase [Paracoccus ravus]|uniref:trypsin-like serine peptidase n=1 Tax=Paracoccus ravus TaxID=2447760 RepID=UPI00106E6294|nr:serine protease [Paracoccus ravus]